MPNLNAFEKRFPKSGVFYLGHASIMAVLNGRKILFDPIVLSKPYDESWTFYPPQIRDESFHNVDAVVVSHIHQDHYDVEFLKSLAPQAKLIIVGGRPAGVRERHQEQVAANRQRHRAGAHDRNLRRRVPARRQSRNQRRRCVDDRFR
jgi:glyoxylase-like metal-dependent hydrolase (beta-lactamase superfamily II)